MQNNCKRLQNDCKAKAIIAKLLQIDYKVNAERLQSDCKAISKAIGDCKVIANKIEYKAIAKPIA
jgi:hypothetical protein